MKKIVFLLMSSALVFLLALSSYADIIVDSGSGGNPSGAALWPWIAAGAAVIAVVLIIFACRRRKRGSK